MPYPTSSQRSRGRQPVRRLLILWLAVAMLGTACSGSDDDPAPGSADDLSESAPSTTEAPALPAPPNDLLADAIEIDPTSLPFTTTVDTTSATADADDDRAGCPAPRSDASVWYTLVSPVDMRVKVSGDGSDFPVGISAISDEDGSFELFECRPFAFEVAIAAGTPYVFQVFDGEDPASAGGTLAFTVEEVERQPTDALAPLGAEFAETVAGNVAVTDGAFMFAVVAEDGEVISGSTGTDADGQEPSPSDVFRVGSITKVFTSLAVLSLVEDGLVALDDAASDHVSRVPVPADVTVRDLLRHTSGIENYTEGDDFFPELFADPARVWTPEDTVELVGEAPPLFEPGSEFSYSNTNYTILGVLIEELTGRAYHEVVRERILDPLGLASTYLAGFEDGPGVFQPYDPESDGDDDYTSIATSAWAGGAMVSSADDLHRFFTALFDNEIVSDALVAEMLVGDDYGLGIELGEAANGLYGHSGGIPGYETFVRHSPDLGMTGFVVSTDQAADTRYGVDQLLEGFVRLAGES